MPDDWDQLGTAAVAERGYGSRADGTPKGLGYFGELKRPDGGVSTELSIGVDFDGKEREIPSLVPTLSQDEVQHLLSGAEPTPAIVAKAVAHARTRINANKDPFAGPGEQADEWSAIGTVGTRSTASQNNQDEWATLATEASPETPQERLNVQTVNHPIATGEDATAAELGAFPQLQTSGLPATLLHQREKMLDARAAAVPGAPDSDPALLNDTTLAGPSPTPLTGGQALARGASNLGKAVFDTPTVPFSKLNITPQQVTDALTPDEASKLPGGIAKATAGTQQAVNGMLEGLTTPFGIATLGVGGVLRGAAARILSGLFAADTARHTPDQVRQLKAAIDSGDPEAIARSGVGLGLTGAFLYGAARHAAEPESPAHDASKDLLKELDAPHPDAEQLQMAAHEFALKATLPDQWEALGVRNERLAAAPKVQPEVVIPPSEFAFKQAAAKPKLGPRSDGVPDILDAVAELGGIQAPGTQKGQGEYDAYAQTFNEGGPASALRGGHNRPDLLMQGLELNYGMRFDKVDDMYSAIARASQAREALDEQLKEQKRIRPEREQEIAELHRMTLEGRPLDFDELAQLEGRLNPRELEKFKPMLTKLHTLAEDVIDPERVPFDPVTKLKSEAENFNSPAPVKETLEGSAGNPADPALESPVPPNAPATPPAGTPGTAQLFHAKLPVTLPRTAEGAVSIPQVMGSLENVITAAGGQTPIRVGRFNMARARGVYNPKTEVTRINSADNIPTATHEIGHASQKLLYGSAYARGLKGLPPTVKKELVALGKALYVATKPAAGYSGEGWAEFIRHYITTDDAAKLAPATEKYFREKVLVDHPEFGRAVKQARDLVDVYRAQGSVARAQQQLVKAPGRIANIVKTVRDTLGYAAQVDEFEPLWKLSQGYEERSGNTLAPSEDPFLLASWKRGTAGATVETMVNDHMIDPYGNPTGGSLRQALAPIKGRGEDFALYLFGRRALERWGKNKNPGLTKADAQYLVSHFDSPEFKLAADNYYEWNRGLMEYVRAADPAMSGTIDAILKSSEDYAPLARVIDPKDATNAAAAQRSNPLARMHGSGRQVRDIFETTLQNAARMVSHANRKLVLDAIVKLSKKEGMGFLVEEVPRSKVRTEVNFEKLRDQLEAAGVDTSAIAQDDVLTYFDLADKPKGVDPIVVVKEADGLHWYHVAPGVYDILNGLDPVRLHPALDLMLGAPARAFRMGTTGLRASFSLFTNPVRDLRTLIMQTKSDANPARLAGSYFSALGQVVRAGLGGKASPYVEAFTRLGAHMGQPLGVDIQHTRRAAKGLFHGRLMRIATNPIDHLRDVLQITESGPRVAELKLIADEVGWKPGTPMTPDQAVQIAMAAKRVTVDFSAGGRIAKAINQAVPFYNATIQGTRSFVRALRDNPARTILYGLATFTVPALLNWWQNKDKEWYRQLPWRERYLYDNVDDGKGNVYQIPRPPEWGNLFSVLPEAMMDSWYRQDPRGAGEALKQILATQNPLDYPVPLKIAKEQWQNRIDFFDRPIIPRGQIDLPPGEQRGPYTTKLAEWLGNAFPGQVSPRRIDAGVRSYFGGAVPDLLDAVGLGTVKRDCEAELSDLPVIGRMFRRGGEFTANNLALGDYYDELTRLSARIQAQDAALHDGRQPLNPLDPREYAYGKALEGVAPYFKAASKVADQTHDLAARQSLYRDMSREAERLLKLKPKVD